MTTPGTDPPQRLAELLETLPADERRQITAWLLGRLPSRVAMGRGGWPLPIGEVPPRLTGALPVGEDSQLVTIRLPSDRHAELRAWCTQHEFTMAAVVRGLVERFLEQQGRGGARA
jgi:hypothetical protein